MYVGSVGLDLGGLIYAASFTVIGYQAIVFPVLTKVYAERVGLLPAGSLYPRLRRLLHLEVGLFIGLALMVLGLIGAVAFFMRWRSTGFGNLSRPEQSVRIVVPATVGLVLGSQTVLGSLFFSILTLGTRDRRGFEREIGDRAVPTQFALDRRADEHFRTVEAGSDSSTQLECAFMMSTMNHPRHWSDLPRRRFEEDGYVVVQGLVPEEQRTRLLREVDRMASLARGEGDIPPEMQVQHGRAGSLRLMKISQLTRSVRVRPDVAHSELFVDIVEVLLGTSARLFRDVVVVKPAHTGGALSYASRPSAYWDVSPPSLVSAWVALTAAPESASCLTVVPGSHSAVVQHDLVLRGRWVVPARLTSALRRVVSAAGTGDKPA